MDFIVKQETTRNGCATRHRFKWDPLPPNEIGSTAQYVRMEKEGKGGVDYN